MKPPLSLTSFGAIVVTILIVAAGRSHAAPGDLDLSFAGSGTKRFGFGGGYDQAYAMAFQPDGKLVLAGTSAKTRLPSAQGAVFSLMRIDTNNVPDASFGNGGIVLTPMSVDGLSFDIARVNAVRVQADGKIVAAGFAYVGENYPTFALVRYNSDGSLDPTFGSEGTGKVFTDFGRPSTIRAMAIQPDGKIIVAGYTNYPANAGEGAVALARYETNGMPDLSFGNGGTQLTPGVTGYTGVHALTLQPDGKILTVGIGIGSGHNGIDFALYRYTTNGELDPEFGGGTGKVFTKVTSANDYFSAANAVAIQQGNFAIDSPDKIVVAGSLRNNSSPNNMFVLARYNLDGSLDGTFGNGGIVTNAISSGGATLNAHATSVLVQGSLFQPRRIVVSGYGTAGGTSYLILARYDASGNPDVTFGTDGSGKVLIPFPGNVTMETHAMLTRSDNLVLGGHLGSGDEFQDFMAARFSSSGVIDTNFGTGGILSLDLIDLNAAAKGVVVQPDGKIVVVGSSDQGTRSVVAVARLNSDGSFDLTFGANGKITTPIGNGASRGNAVLLQPDGRIVVAGMADNGASTDFAVIRYTPGGELDGTFGTNGIALTPIGPGSDEAVSIALQGDGKLVVAGMSHSGMNYDFAVVRYTTNGIPDTTFDGDGKVMTAVAGGEDVCSAVRIQADGKIVVAGYAEVNGSYDFALVRYQPNGALDGSFGSFGRVATDFGGGSVDAAYALIILSDGKILAAGTSGTGANLDLALVRYATNGVPDNSFNGDGKVTMPFGLTTDYILAAEQQKDGKIVGAVVTVIGARPEFAAARFNLDGSPDASFGIGGKSLIDFADGTDNYLSALALDEVGRAVLVGDAGGQFGLARLQGDPVLRITTILPLANRRVLLMGTGVPSANHTLLGSPTPRPSTFTGLGVATADATGLWEYEDEIPAGVMSRFYQLTFP